jgi:hypothetical protein
VTEVIGVVEQMYPDFNFNVLALVNMNAMIRICLCDPSVGVPLHRRMEFTDVISRFMVARCLGIHGLCNVPAHR